MFFEPVPASLFFLTARTSLFTSRTPFFCAQANILFILTFLSPCCGAFFFSPLSSKDFSFFLSLFEFHSFFIRRCEQFFFWLPLDCFHFYFQKGFYSDCLEFLFLLKRRERPLSHFQSSQLAHLALFIP